MFCSLLSIELVLSAYPGVCISIPDLPFRSTTILCFKMTSPRTTSLRRLTQLSSQVSESSRSISSSSSGGPINHAAYCAAHPPAPIPLPLDAQSLRASMLARPEVLTPDCLSPMPSQLLNASLADFLPAAAVPPSPTTTLAEAYHLIHFPLQLRPSLLVADGTDPYNLPGAPWERRLWAGGRVAFHRPLPTRGQEAVCREHVADVSVKGRPGGEKIFVDVVRRYGEGAMFADGDEAVTESRTLVFMKGRTPEEAKAEAAKGGRVVKGEECRPETKMKGTDKNLNLSSVQTELQTHPDPDADALVQLQRSDLQRPPDPPQSAVLPRGGRPPQPASPRPAVPDVDARGPAVAAQGPGEDTQH